MGNTELQNMLKIAIQAEEDGYKFYTDTSKKTKNPLGKAAFKALSNDEEDHIRSIKAFYAHLCENKTCPNIKSLSKSRVEISQRPIFSRLLKDFKSKIDVASDDINSYKFAMDLENSALKFYKEALTKTKDNEDLKKLLTFLIGEEKGHFNLLQSTYEYLSDPSGWFLKEEKPIVEG